MSWEDVQALRKAGRFREAIRVANDILSQGHDRKVRTQLDWSWYGLIKDLVGKTVERLKGSQPTTSEVSELLAALRGYAKQSPIRPDNPLSNIVREVSKVAHLLQQFPSIVRWVGPEGLAIEDWDYQERGDTVYRPVAMAVARGLAKWVRAHPDANQADIELAREWLERIRPVARGDDALWLDWDLVLMLRRSGDFRLAAECLSSVLKAKRNEFWVWAEAARLHVADQPELAKACFCRALECGAEPKFTVNVHRELAELLAHQQDFAQASREVLQAIDIRDREGWGIDAPLQHLIESAWYDPAADGAEAPKTFYAQHSSDALVLCFDHVETCSATYLGFLIPHTPKDPPPGWKARPLARFAIFDTSGKSLSVVAPGMRNLKLDQGAPVSVVIGRQEEDGRETIVHVTPRTEGTAWDCTREGAGVVVREANTEKPMKLFVGRDSEEISCDAAWLGPEPARVGQGVRFRQATNPKNGRVDVFEVEPGPLPDDDVKLLQGSLRRNPKGFAFIDDAFVPPHVLETVAPSIETVVALVVCGKHPTRNEYSWRAVKLSAA